MKRLDSILHAYTATDDNTKGKVLGAAFVVVNKDGVVYEGAAGRTGISLESPKFTVDSCSWVASMTKIITCTCLMQLVEKNVLNLDDDMRPLVSQLAQMQILREYDEQGHPILEDNGKPITLRNLLTHTVGLGYDIADPDLVKWSGAVGRTATNLEYSLDGWNTPLKFAPGEGWYYGSAIDWASQALEKVTGQTLGRYMTQQIFQPLGMKDTTFYRESLQHVQSRRVDCSFRNAETGELTGGPHPVPAIPPVESGGAGLYTTAADHAKILRALLKASHEDGIVAKATIQEMLRPQLTDAQKSMLTDIMEIFHDAFVPEFDPKMPLDHGIGGIINMDHSSSKRRKGSMSWLGMANGHWWLDPESGIAATLVVNVLPHPDPVVNQLWIELEQAVYEDLAASSSI